jgi:hypothetical protein
MLTIKNIINIATLKRVLNITLLSILLIGMIYFTLLEPSVTNATGASVAASVTVTSEIVITAPTTLAIGTIPGITGNKLAPISGTVAFTVTSNASSGFDMGLTAPQAPSMYLVGGSYTTTGQFFSDYTPTAGVSTPDGLWTGTGAGGSSAASGAATGTAVFGYAVGAGTSADADQEFKFSTPNCNAGAGTNTTTNCFMGLRGASSTRVIHRTTWTTNTGVTETIKFLAESWTFLDQGTYTANVTATVADNS